MRAKFSKNSRKVKFRLPKMEEEARRIVSEQVKNGSIEQGE